MCRVAQLKDVQIPQLELQGPLLEVWLMIYIAREENFQIKVIVFWIEPGAILHWPPSAPQKQVNRVAKIFDTNDVTQLQQTSWCSITSYFDGAAQGTATGLV